MKVVMLLNKLNQTRANNLKVNPHLSYLPALAHKNFSLFLQMKKIQRKLHMNLRTHKECTFKGPFAALPKCIDVKRNSEKKKKEAGKI